ncbi:uncharacterized protein L201_006782 [Kwoniella dendrophila CBS 6074]|uniref:Short-chain dehydrogenase/reductase SDR n=1 Tax=Kwoniella dendrophila CBS 6074 TaxID=1295534 RepID=A0AAX4K4Z8_9TREE
MTSPSDTTTTVFITGVNSGIGYETVLALLKSTSSYKIFLGARSVGKAQDAINRLKGEIGCQNSEIYPVVVDLEDDESIQSCFQSVSRKTGRIDILINNAGASFDSIGPSQGMTTRHVFNKTWDINVTGTHILTHTFVPLLIQSPNPRLLFLTSGSASLSRTEDPNWSLNKSPLAGWPKEDESGCSGGYLSYKSSKVGLNMVMREWHRILKNDKVKVWSINPGTVLTNFGGDRKQLIKWGAKDPSTSGNFIKDVIEGKRDNDIGKIVNPPNAPTGDILPW